MAFYRLERLVLQQEHKISLARFSKFEFSRLYLKLLKIYFDSCNILDHFQVSRSLLGIAIAIRFCCFLINFIRKKKKFQIAAVQRS